MAKEQANVNQAITAHLPQLLQLSIGAVEAVRTRFLHGSIVLAAVATQRLRM